MYHEDLYFHLSKTNSHPLQPKSLSWVLTLYKNKCVCKKHPQNTCTLHLVPKYRFSAYGKAISNFCCGLFLHNRGLCQQKHPGFHLPISSFRKEKITLVVLWTLLNHISTSSSGLYFFILKPWFPLSEAGEFFQFVRIVRPLGNDFTDHFLKGAITSAGKQRAAGCYWLEGSQL